MRKSTLFILCLLCLGIHHFAIGQQTDANIFGHVVDKSTGQHLPFVNVVVKGTSIGIPTDESGHYFLSNLPTGRQVVEASCIGYKTTDVEITVVKGLSVEVNIEMDIDSQIIRDVVVSANRFEINRREATSIVNVLTPATLDHVNAVNLAQGLNFQPGLRVENNCQNCGTTQVRINGLEGKYSQILIDSRPVFSALAGVYGLEQIPVAMIDRVEVVRGGGSALFGANAIGGVINVITREPVKNSLEVSHTSRLVNGKAWDNTTFVNAALLSTDNRAGAYLFGSSHTRQGYDHDGDGFTELGMQRNMSIGTRAYYRFSQRSKLNVEYHNLYEFRRGGDSIDLRPHLCQVAEQAEHHVHGGSLNYDFLSKNSRFQLSAFTSAQFIDRDTYYGTQCDLDAYGDSKDFSSVTGTQVSYRFDRFLFMPSILMGGVEWAINHLVDIQPAYDRIVEQKINIASAFAQNEWKNEKVSLLVGLRADKHNLMKRVVFSPRANIRWSPMPSLTTRASYSSGFRAPQSFDEDLHIMAVGGEVALISLSPDLKPEYSHSFSGSIGWEHPFNTFFLELLVEGFYTNLQDVFVLRSMGTDSQGNLLLERCNGSGAYVGGVNVEARLRHDNLRLETGYTWQRSRYKEPEAWSENPNIEAQKRMFRTPDHYGYLTALIPFTRRFETAFTATYTGPMLVQHFAGYIENDSETVTPSFFDLALKLTYDLPLAMGTNLQVNGGVQNILNSFQKDFDQGPLRDAGYIYGPALPRTYFIGMKVSL